MMRATRAILELPPKERSATIAALGDYLCELGRREREFEWCERKLRPVPAPLVARDPTQRKVIVMRRIVLRARRRGVIFYS